jgi:hypothetical protein
MRFRGHTISIVCVVLIKCREQQSLLDHPFSNLVCLVISGTSAVVIRYDISFTVLTLYALNFMVLHGDVIV